MATTSFSPFNKNSFALSHLGILPSLIHYEQLLFLKHHLFKSANILILKSLFYNDLIDTAKIVSPMPNTLQARCRYDVRWQDAPTGCGLTLRIPG
jgi:hypothetical protein